ncbi:hypothetical protein [Brevundimonas sp. KM4]|uniref:hypothetical protein n=1 Tax=Brevundimonas sp. KM4 TaxID=1628191 RepID=UPI0009E507D7
MKAEARHPIQIFNAKMRPRWSAMLSAAPASPLPGGGDEALIAELKEAKGLLADLMTWFGKYPEFKPNPDYMIGVTEDISKTRAFLARNGKGEGRARPKTTSCR